MTTISKKLFSVVLMGIVLLLSGCKTELYSKLDETDANAMLAIIPRSLSSFII